MLHRSNALMIDVNRFHKNSAVRKASHVKAIRGPVQQQTHRCLILFVELYLSHTLPLYFSRSCLRSFSQAYNSLTWA